MCDEIFESGIDMILAGEHTSLKQLLSLESMLTFPPNYVFILVTCAIDKRYTPCLEVLVLWIFREINRNQQSVEDYMDDKRTFYQKFKTILADSLETSTDPEDGRYFLHIFDMLRRIDCVPIISYLDYTEFLVLSQAQEFKGLVTWLCVHEKRLLSS